MDNPLLDFHQPWVALITLALTYLLPRLVGLVTTNVASAGLKIAVLGILSVVTQALTYLLTVAVANSWGSLDWTALANVIVNAGLTFAIANGVFKGVIQPLGQAEKDKQSAAIAFIGPKHLATASDLTKDAA